MPGIRSARRHWLAFVVANLLGLLSILLFLSQAGLDPLASACVYGVGIMAAAFILSWAAEVAELDISASLAVAILVLLTVLPEYAIEAVLAWDAGAAIDPLTSSGQVITEQTRRVAANATGATQLLFGVAWPAVVLVYWLRYRQAVDVHGALGPELVFLAVAVIPAFAVFFLKGIHLALAILLIGVFVAYLWASSKKDAEEPELAGIAAWLGSLPTWRRRMAVALLFLYAMVILLFATEPFVQNLVDTGRRLGIDEFVLIQLIAPLATETPEIVVAVLFALRGDAGVGIAVCISSAIIKLTLLTGSTVLIFSLSAGRILTFPLDDRQAVEILLTASVGLFGLALAARGTLDWRAAAALLGLFAARWFFPALNAGTEHRLWFALVYLGLAGALVGMNWRRLKR